MFRCNYPPPTPINSYLSANSITPSESIPSPPRRDLQHLQGRKMIPPYPPDDRFTTSFSCRATYISPITTTTRGQRRKKILGEREKLWLVEIRRGRGGGDMSRQSKQLKSINRPKRTVCGPTQGVGGITRVPVDEDRSKRRASEEEEEKLGR